MTQYEHVDVICYRPEVAGDVENVKTIEGYVVLNFELASFGSFRDIPKNHFVTAAEAGIDDSIKRKCIHVSLKNLASQPVHGLFIHSFLPFHVKRWLTS